VVEVVVVVAVVVVVVDPAGVVTDVCLVVCDGDLVCVKDNYES